MKWRILIIALIIFQKSYSQSEDFSWWNKKHNWDGITPWSQYIISSPGKMGPNALPVPEVRGAFLEDSSSILLRYDQHGGFGDNTQNLFTQITINVIPKRISFMSWVVPFEKFRLDSIVRDERRCRSRSGKGYAGGDVYFSSLINILLEKEYLPATSFEASVKTASGTNLANARYTDSPGYIFCLHTTKTIYKKNNYRYCLNFNTGFFSWQTNQDLYRQNDAFVYGSCISMQHKQFSFNGGIKGYYGYINDGDRPLIIFLQGTKNFGQIKLNINLSYGINDFPYQSVGLGVSYYPRFIKEGLIRYSKLND